jgi:hypothetical protein
MGCRGEEMTFDLRPGHSPHLGEVRIDSTSPDVLAVLRRESPNDALAVGSLRIDRWSEEEVAGSITAVNVLPNGVVVPIQMWFRLDWQAKDHAHRLVDCDPYRSAARRLQEQAPSQKQP